MVAERISDKKGKEKISHNRADELDKFDSQWNIIPNSLQSSAESWRPWISLFLLNVKYYFLESHSNSALYIKSTLTLFICFVWLLFDFCLKTCLGSTKILKAFFFFIIH